MNKKELNERLYCYSEFGDLEKVTDSLERGADVHYNRDAPLYWACCGGHIEVVEVLVEHGACIEARDGRPLIDSASDGHLEVVKYLISKGATRLDEALSESAREGHLDVVEYLLDLGANPAIDGHKAFINAAASENWRIPILILDVYKESIPQEILLEMLYKAVRVRNMDLIQCLVDKGVNVIADDNEAICIAGDVGLREILKYLIEQGADPHARNERPLFNAIQSNRLEAVEYLVSKHNPDLSVNDDELVKLAIKKDTASIVEILLNHNISSVMYYDIMHYAVGASNMDLLRKAMERFEEEQ